MSGPSGGPALPTATGQAPGTAWRRLPLRMIWVDLAQSLLALTPAAIAVWVVGVEPTTGFMWPVFGIAAWAVFGALTDAWRWAFTRYRVTDDHVEGRTGLLVRQFRSIRRDRIRSVDVTATLRHRLTGLRVVLIGAGQQAAANESAVELDAVLVREAEDLRRALLGDAPARVAAQETDGATRTTTSGPAEAEPAAAEPAASEPADTATEDATAGPATAGPHPAQPRPAERVFARLRPWWVVYNVLNIWAFLLALGLLWGAQWLASTFGVDLAGTVVGFVDWEALGLGRTIALGILAVGAVGVVGMAVVFFSEYWRFELTRVPGEHGTVLRTRHGLLKTREVSRDDNRLRGVEISEPLLWRWMGMADTSVITTGLDVNAMSQPAAILPRGPVRVARPVAAAVLAADPDPLAAPLRPHPRAALRRRLWWATGVIAVVAAVLGRLVATDVLPGWTLWTVAALWPLALGCAVVAYRALGHAVVGDYVVVRSGLVNRSTAALRRQAVSTIAVRQSLLQRRLGLASVSAMTAAGWGAYEATDVAAADAVALAVQAAPGLMDPFLAGEAAPDRSALH